MKSCAARRRARHGERALALGDALAQGLGAGRREAGSARRYAAEGMSVAKWREQRRRSREFNVLLVINPTGDLPGAVEEGERVAAMLTQLPGRRHHGDPRRRRDARAPARGVPLGRLRRDPFRRPCLVRSRGARVERHPLRGRARALGGRPRGDGLRAGARLLQCLRIRAPARNRQSAPAARPQRRLRRGVPARRRRELRRHLVAGLRRCGIGLRDDALPRSRRRASPSATH